MASYLGDVKDKEELKQKLKQQKALTKQTIKKVQKYFKSEHIKPLEWQNASANLFFHRQINKPISCVCRFKILVP